MRRSGLGSAAAAAALLLAGCGGDDGNAERPGTRPEAPAEGRSAELAVEVDGRVELLSVLFRLAGAPPYGEAATPYALAADEHFGAVAGHPAVIKTRELVSERGISYEAPVELAVYLDSGLEPIRPLEPLPPGLDPRWEGVDLDRYLADVRDFSAASSFEEFEAAQAGYAADVESTLTSFLADRPVIDWFEDAFGHAGAEFTVVPGLLSGSFSFAASAEQADGQTELAPILYLEAPDADGVPTPTELSFEFLVHELAHGWVDPVFDARVEEMRGSALPLFREVEELMRQQAYSSYPIMVNESVVRALVVSFLRERAGEEPAERSLAEQEQLGFIWTAELAEAIEALREEGGGRVEPDALVEATQQVFEEAR